GYLLEEVLHLQSDQVQNFLLLTSVLGRFNAELCNALTLNDDGHKIIEYLHRSNLFLIPLDNKNNWFRYHHLFADLLRAKLKQQRSSIVKELQTRACLWCEENDLLEEAIGYALEIEDWDRALNLIEPIGYSLFSVARFDRLKLWAESIPETAFRTHPMVCYWFVLPLIYKEEFDEAERYLKMIETAEPEEMRHSLLSSVWSSRCYISIARADLEKSLDYSARSVDLLQPENTVQQVITKHAIVATSLLVGDMKEIEQKTLDALPIYRQHEHVLFEVWGMIFLGYVRAMQGHLRAGVETLHATIKFINEKAPNRYEPLILPNSFLCDIYRELNDIENATTHLNEALKIIDKTGRESDIVLVPDSLKSLAIMLEMNGDTGRSSVLIESGMNRMKKCGNEVFVRQLQALNAFLHLRRGEINVANSWGDSCGLSPDDRPTYLRELEYLTFARWLIATDRSESALPLLASIEEAAKEGSRHRIVLETLILKVVAHSSSRNEEKALDSLEEALVLAESGSYVRSFVDEGETMSKLLIECLKRNGKKWEVERPELLHYVIKLNESFPPIASFKPQKQKVAGDGLPWWYVNDPLSERELEVMQLVAQGLSNHEIGNKIFISPGTVKRHLSNIYQKLDVHSRVQAIDLARKFKLIPPFTDS
ncbi:MAG: LuxR C-terminal-related transcriptional regulator, partial [Pyrinomonadaceae bacterium]